MEEENLDGERGEERHAGPGHLHANGPIFPMIASTAHMIEKLEIGSACSWASCGYQKPRCMPHANNKRERSASKGPNDQMRCKCDVQS
jgi:hypothetical protein